MIIRYAEYPNAEVTFKGVLYRFKNGELMTDDKDFIDFISQREGVKTFDVDQNKKAKISKEDEKEFIETLQSIKKDVEESKELEAKEESKEPEKKKFFSK